jgi:hypothetical protein
MIDRIRHYAIEYFYTWKGVHKMGTRETRREKFVRIVEARTNKIINMIQLLGNCSNVSAYEYTSGDIDKIFSAIENELKEARKKFNKIESRKSTRFTLE